MTLVSVLIALVVILVILGYTIYDLNAKYGVQKIFSININEKFFNATVNIIADRRADYVFPTDELVYEIEWKNKIDDTIEIISRLEGTIGESTSFAEPKEFDKITLTKDGVSTTKHKFTLDKEGQHSLKYIIIIVNHTDKTNLGLKEIPTKIEILSRSDQLQQDSNNWTVVGIMISATVVSIAIIGNVFEINRSRNERNDTLRAWIGLTTPEINILSYIDDKNEEKNEDEIRKMNEQGIKFNWTKIRRSFELKNYGQLPATEVKSRSKMVGGRQPKLNEINETQFGSSATIFPNSMQHMIFETTNEMEDLMADPNISTYFLFETQYTSTNSKKIRKIGSLLKLQGAHYTIINNWDESNVP